LVLGPRRMDPWAAGPASRASEAPAAECPLPPASLAVRAFVVGGPRSGQSRVVDLCCGASELGREGPGPCSCVLHDPLRGAWSVEVFFSEVPPAASLAEFCGLAAGTTRATACLLLVVDSTSAASFRAACERAPWAAAAGHLPTFVLSSAPAASGERQAQVEEMP
ncbi:unnamed protein product, partial [Prorocentrum cordatum]